MILLIHKDTKRRVIPGDAIKDFRGDSWTFVSFNPNGATAKVSVAPATHSGMRREFYWTVFQNSVEIVEES